jgi:hypothetical protein
MIPTIIHDRFSYLSRHVKGMHVYAVIDGLQYERQTGAWLDKSDARLTPLFAGTEDEPLAHAGPWLVDVTSNDQAAAIVKLEKSCPSVVWLLSNDDPVLCATKLRARLNATLPDGKEVIMRFWDPRALRAISKHVSAETQRTLFSAALNWFVFLNGRYDPIAGQI